MKKNNKIYTMKNLWLLRGLSQQSIVVSNSDQSPTEHGNTHQQLKQRLFIKLKQSLQRVFLSPSSKQNRYLYNDYKGE